MAEVVATIAGSVSDSRVRVVRLAGGAFAVEVQQLFDATDAGGESHGQFWGTVSYPRRSSTASRRRQSSRWRYCGARKTPNQAPQQTAGQDSFLGLQAHRCPAAAELCLFGRVVTVMRVADCGHRRAVK